MSLVFAKAPRAHATGVPVGGFLPLVGIGLTDEFLEDTDPAWDFFAHPSAVPGGNWLGAGAGSHFDLALLDTGAAVSLLTSASDAVFGIDEDSDAGGSDGFRGENELTLGGASGFLQAQISDPLGLYAGGLQGRTGDGPLVMPNSAMKGQTNTSLLTIPPESDLPNVLGLTFASQYATRIRNDLPQVFTSNGQTVRTPAIEFLPLASGGTGAGLGGANIIRRAPLQLNPGSSFTSEPFYFPDFFSLEDFTEDPTQPTVIQGGLFLNVNASTPNGSLNNSQFFFDTGADVTVLSEFSALQLGFDPVLQTPAFTVAVVGSGGTKLEVPGFFLDTFTIPALGGSITLNHVPVIVLNVTNPADPGNVVPGIVGTNVLSGRNVVIDPDPSIGGGNLGPQLYISDPVTTNSNWSSTVGAVWDSSTSWSAGSAPNLLTVANVLWAAGVVNTAIISTNVNAWEVNVSGASASQTMTLQVSSGGRLTTFAGLNIETSGHVRLNGGLVDVQNIDIRDGGRLSGIGSIATGSGPIPGQVENVSGIVSPGEYFGPGNSELGVLQIEGRYSNGAQGTLQIELGTPTWDRLVVQGPVALAGTLQVNLFGGLVPSLGQQFMIVTSTDEIGGEFDVLNMPTLPEGRGWFVDYDTSFVTLRVTIAGDFNGDSIVDSGDLATWRAGYGTKFSSADFLVWQRYLGSQVIAVATGAAIPEPSAFGLALTSLAAIGAMRRRVRR